MCKHILLWIITTLSLPTIRNKCMSFYFSWIGILAWEIHCNSIEICNLYHTLIEIFYPSNCSFLPLHFFISFFLPLFFLSQVSGIGIQITVLSVNYLTKWNFAINFVPRNVDRIIYLDNVCRHNRCQHCNFPFENCSFFSAHYICNVLKFHIQYSRLRCIDW